jgi:chaperonin GroES
LADRVLVKRVPAKEKSVGGIIIPDNAKEKPIEGTVVAVGTGKVLDDGRVQAVAVKVGENVLFGKYAGTEIKIEDVEHTILAEADVLGVLEA